MSISLIIGSRASFLARIQTFIVKQELKKNKSIMKERIDDFQSFTAARGSQWVIPDGTQKKTRFCESCSTYNYAVSDYCTTCGSFMN